MIEIILTLLFFIFAFSWLYELIRNERLNNQLKDANNRIKELERETGK